MNRRRFCGELSAVGVALLCDHSASAFVRQTDNGAIDPETDSYAIWSILIPVLRPSAHKYLVPIATQIPQIRTVLSPEVPLTPFESVQRGLALQVQVPSYARVRFTQAQREYDNKNQVPATLQRRLSLMRPYMLMSKANLDDYSRIKPTICVADPNHPWKRDLRLEAKYANFAKPCLFSRVYFDAERSLGLVCAESERNGYETYCFEKGVAGWKRQQWPSTAISMNC